MIFGKRSERLAVIVASSLRSNWTISPRRHAACPRTTMRPRRSRPQGHAEARRNIGALPKHLPRCEQVIELTDGVPLLRGPVLHKIGEDVSSVDGSRRSAGTRTIVPNMLPRLHRGVWQAKVLPRLTSAASTAREPRGVSKFAWYLPLIAGADSGRPGCSSRSPTLAAG